MFYRVKVNAAIAKLGVRPLDINPDFRAGIQTMGKRSGISPEEVALFLVAQLPIIYRANLKPSIVQDWIWQRKVDTKQDEMRNALNTLALWDLMG